MLAVCLAVWLTTGGAAAQKPASVDLTTQTQPVPAIRSAADLTFANIAAAPFRTVWQAVQVRRLLDSSNQLVQVRERVTVAGDGTPGSPFQLEFLDLIGATPSPAQRQQWRETYGRHASLLHQHGGFAVRDLAAAARNYALYDFGVARRAGREVRRAVVFPIVAGKGMWVLDVDTATGIVLYAGEYDRSLRLLGEVEIVSLAVGSQVPALQPGWNWTPRLRVQPYATPRVAIANLRAQVGIAPQFGALVAEYVVHKAQITTDPLNGEETLVIGYTDGIDEFFVIETPQADPLANSPSSHTGPNASQAHTITTYEDPALRVYLFHEKGVTFQIVGSNSLERLRDVAMRLCQQAVTGA